MKERAKQFLDAHGMWSGRIVPSEQAEAMREDMERGLAGERSDMPMIPAYLSHEGSIRPGQTALAIDAGGTNFRCALLRFGAEGCTQEGTATCRMPGVDVPTDWDSFIRFVADRIQPMLDRTDRIGFCFSYSAHITPEMDGRVVCMDKEVTVEGSAGRLVGASLLAELERRGLHGKRVVVINDTVAALLGGSSALNPSAYDGFAGQVSGTGTNTCCSLPLHRIGKLKCPEERQVLVNLESGMYAGLPRGDFDRELDRFSANPGQKHLEKMTAGVYLGDLFVRMLRCAVEEGLLSERLHEKLEKLGKIDASHLDGWSCGEKLEQLSEDAEEATLIQVLAKDLFERSARCMCTNLLAIMLLTGKGRNKDRPFCICAEGSLVQKGRCYRPTLERLLAEEGEKLGRYAVLKTGGGSTLPGSAAAALLNG